MPDPKKREPEEQKRLEEVAHKFYHAFADRLGDAFTHTEEEFTKGIFDESKAALHDQAYELSQRDKKSAAILARIKQDYHLRVNPGLIRGANYQMDTSDTPEAEKKNVEFVKQIATHEGADRELTRQIALIHTFDYASLFTDDPQKKIDIYREHGEDIRVMFAFKSCLENGGFILNPDLADYINDLSPFFEAGAQIGVDINLMGSDCFLALPDDLPTDQLALCSQDLAETYAIVGEDGKKDISSPRYAEASDTVMKFLSHEFERDHHAFVRQGYKKMAEEGLITPRFTFDFKANADFTPDETLLPHLKEYLTTRPAKNADYMFYVYGVALEIYEKEGNKEQTFEDFKKAHGLNNMFVPRPQADKDKISAVFERGNVILSNLEARKFIQNCVNEVEKQVNAPGGTRSYKRNEAVVNTLTELFSPEKEWTQDGIRVPNILKQATALKVSQLLEEKHASRGFWWKVFHRSQFNAEEEAIQNAKNVCKNVGKFDMQLATRARTLLKKIDEGLMESSAAEMGLRVRNENGWTVIDQEETKVFQQNLAEEIKLEETDPVQTTEVVETSPQEISNEVSQEPEP